MGLRIGFNEGALSALRSISQANQVQGGALERISTSLRINRASDDPSGLVISEQLLSQLGGIDQAVQNTENASNLINTADAGIGQINDLLTTVRGLAVSSANTGGLSQAAIDANQAASDQAIQAIDRIANTTRFADAALLNGSQAIQTKNNSVPAIQDIRVLSAQFSVPPPQNVGVNVVAAATQAQATGTINPAQAQASTITLRGENGTATLNFAAGASRAGVAAAINATTQQTGVVADPLTGVVRSQNVGSAAFVDFRVTSGSFGGVVQGFSQGTDVQGTIGGQQATGNRETLSVATPQLNAQVTFQNGTGPGAFNFDITGGGLVFQIGPNATAADQVRVGIDALTSGRLGQPGNPLATIATGQANSVGGNPQGAIGVIDTAINQVSTSRASLGATDAFVLQAQRNALEVAFQNLSASNSSIRDADIAEEVSRSLRGQLLRQAGISSLQQSNISQQSVLRLLGGGQG